MSSKQDLAQHHPRRSALKGFQQAGKSVAAVTYGTDDLISSEPRAVCGTRFDTCREKFRDNASLLNASSAN
jgi:hypothetical protein